MTWFRVDDGFVDHPKLDTLAADPLVHAFAVAAWTLMGVDCARRRTDGLFSEARMRKVLTWPEGQVVQARDALLSAGLWRRAEGLLSFHDWSDYQPTKAELDKAKRAATERQRRWRQEKAARNAGVDASTNTVTDGVTNASVDAWVDTPVTQEGVDATPSRPVPTRPIERERALGWPAGHLGKLAEFIRAGVGEGFESLGEPPPFEVRAIGWDGWGEIARWVRERAQLRGDDVEETARELVRRFLENGRAAKAGYPISWLRQNPLQFFAEAA